MPLQDHTNSFKEQERRRHNNQACGYHGHFQWSLSLSGEQHAVLSILQSHVDQKMIICHAYLLSLEEDHGTRPAAAAHAREERRTKFAIVIGSFLTYLPLAVAWGMMTLIKSYVENQGAGLLYEIGIWVLLCCVYWYSHSSGAPWLRA